MSHVVRKPVFRVSDQVQCKLGCVARHFGFRKKVDSTIYVVKTKALISCPVTVRLICVFVFAYVKSRLSNDAVLSVCL